MGKSTKKVAKEKKAKVAAERPAAAEAKGAEPRKGTGREVQVALEALKGKAKDAQEGLDGARAEAKKLEEQGGVLVDAAKEGYLKALTPYREACGKAGVVCEFEGSRAQNKTAMVRFLVEKTEKGVRVMLKGKPDTAEVIPLAKLKESISREAYSFVDRHVGPREKVGNKGGGLGNRIRAVMA